MYFSTAGIEVFPLIPLGAAFVVSFFASMGGFSGAFLLLPFQMSVLGFTNVSVSPTNQLYNVFANPAGFWRYYREGRMLWPLAWIVLVGTIPGLFVGALIRVYLLPEARDFKLFVGLVLFVLALQLLRSMRHPPVKPVPCACAEHPACNRVQVETHTWKQVVYTFGGCRYRFSVPMLGLVCGIVGLIGGIYGIGGGAIISPFLVSVFGLPVYTIAGATLFATSLSSIAGVLFYSGLAVVLPHLSVAPDWGMASLLGIGGFSGMYFGARCQRFVPARAIQIMMVCVLAGTAGMYFFDFVTN